ncbi:hypothetical protein [Leisingera sp. M658]|uniref:hypothetical protein n=1 Tax=Leisingera sp. M658 TaxID=2867015 RepID=UPI0021A8D4CE|nr:hypothetical protein [Leisingera sp. M658]UWQ74431.1 hypothetical protein K3724_18445 [Leisingera sp. M658]
MDWMWTWSGECFGYRDGYELWTHDGKHVGKFCGDDVYGRDGRYLGEVMNQNRLITNYAKSGWVKAPFAPYARRAGYAKYANCAGYAMYAGHQDFPKPDTFS